MALRCKGVGGGGFLDLDGGGGGGAFLASPMSCEDLYTILAERVVR